MSTREKFLSLLGLAVLVAAVVAYSQYQTKLHNAYRSQPGFPSRQASTVPTGNVDNATNELLEDVAGEVILSSEEDADADIIDDDSQAISAIGETYVGNEF